MKEWIPEADFQKADFSYNEKKKVSEYTGIKPEKQKTKQPDSLPEKKEYRQEEKKITKWMPPKLEDLNKEKTKSNKVTGAEKKGQGDLSEKKMEVARVSNRDSYGEYMEGMIQEHLKETADVLKKWFWASPARHLDIFVILRSLKKETLVPLFQMLTIAERKQFWEIYKRNYRISQGEVLAARKRFLESLREVLS